MWLKMYKTVGHLCIIHHRCTYRGSIHGYLYHGHRYDTPQWHEFILQTRGVNCKKVYAPALWLRAPNRTNRSVGRRRLRKECLRLVSACAGESSGKLELSM